MVLADYSTLFKAVPRFDEAIDAVFDVAPRELKVPCKLIGERGMLDRVSLVSESVKGVSERQYLAYCLA